MATNEGSCLSGIVEIKTEKVETHYAVDCPDDECSLSVRCDYEEMLLSIIEDHWKKYHKPNPYKTPVLRQVVKDPSFGGKTEDDDDILIEKEFDKDGGFYDEDGIYREPKHNHKRSNLYIPFRQKGYYIEENESEEKEEVILPSTTAEFLAAELSYSIVGEFSLHTPPASSTPQPSASSTTPQPSASSTTPQPSTTSTSPQPSTTSTPASKETTTERKEQIKRMKRRDSNSALSTESEKKKKRRRRDSNSAPPTESEKKKRGPGRPFKNGKTKVENNEKFACVHCGHKHTR